MADLFSDYGKTKGSNAVKVTAWIVFLGVVGFGLGKWVFHLF